MKFWRALILGGVAGLLGSGAAAAAERHAKGDASDHAKNCRIYGPGFRYVPGADLCMKVGGWARAEAGSGPNWRALNDNPNSRATGDARMGAQGYLTTDVREGTKYGTVRAYLSVGTKQQ